MECLRLSEDQASLIYTTSQTAVDPIYVRVGKKILLMSSMTSQSFSRQQRVGQSGCGKSSRRISGEMAAQVGDLRYHRSAPRPGQFVGGVSCVELVLTTAPIAAVPKCTVRNRRRGRVVRALFSFSNLLGATGVCAITIVRSSCPRLNTRFHPHRRRSLSRPAPTTTSASVRRKVRGGSLDSTAFDSRLTFRHFIRKRNLPVDPCFGSPPIVCIDG